MSSIGQGSGQQHLLALLHAMRLKADAPLALSAEPEPVHPAPNHPGAAQPGAAQPGAAQPGAAQPGGGVPGQLLPVPAAPMPVLSRGSTPAISPTVTPPPGATPIHGTVPGAGQLPPIPVPPLLVPPALLHGTVPTPAVHGPVAPPAPPGPPVDGMSPADTLHLHELQRLLRTSLSLAGPIEEVCGRLRAALTQAVPQLVAALPGTPASQQEQLRVALTWLVEHQDDPPLLAAGCGQLGGALREFGVQPQQLQLMGAALAEAMRAGMAGAWRQDYDAAWRSTWQHAHSWIAQGSQMAAFRPISWTAAVVGHDRRAFDLAVLRLRPYLPMPYRPGQFARIEVPGVPGVRRPYSLVGSNRLDNVVELHVRAKSDTGVSGALVHDLQVDDLVRISRAEGPMGLPPTTERDLLMIAGDTGVAPFKAMLIELAATGDHRSAVLFWGVRTLEDLYDLDEVAAIARLCRRATVIPVISNGNPGPYPTGLVTDAVAEFGEWSQHEVFVAGPSSMLVATTAVLHTLGIEPERIHHDTPEPR